MAMRTIPLLVLVVTFPFVAMAHGEFRWVMENPKTSWCCSKEDCRDLKPGEARWTPDGYTVNGQKPVRVYESPHAHEQHMSACFTPEGSPRCLFRVPAGI